MSADAIIYCLERVTDYRSFERFCSALLAGAGYSGIDPLGGTGDGGRDAIIRTDGQGRRIVFAYTVRSDWRAKLEYDCVRVREMRHDPDVFVFVCTEGLSASEKDSANSLVVKTFGWTLDLFDLERLRVQLVGPQRHLLAQHASIFTPPFFPQRGGESVAESRDTLLIDHVAADHALATWLARRLSLAGYRTWCQGTAPLAGEDVDDTVRRLLEARAQLYLPVVSPASLSERVFLERCTIAANRAEFVLPCSTAVEYGEAPLPSRLAKIAPACFSTSWHIGLAEVLAGLTTRGLRPELDVHRGRKIALGDYLPTRVTTAKPEPVFANVFPLTLPKKMLIFDLRRPLAEAEIADLRSRWAFIEVHSYTLVAFEPPPENAIPALEVDQAPELTWEETRKKDGKKTLDLAKELARRSLELVCAKKGLKFCPNRQVFYFSEYESGAWNQSIRHVDGRLTTVQLTGMRTKGWGERASPFLYQLAPRFSPWRDFDGTWNVVVRIYIRVTTLDGVPFEGKEIGRRRKVVSKSWWNKEWLARLLGVVQALETSDGRIEVGEGLHSVVMLTSPLNWQCPVGLDVLALSGLSDLGEEMATYRTREDDDHEDEIASDRAEKVLQS